MARDIPNFRLDPITIAGDVALSYTHTVLAVYLSLADPFFARSLRRIYGQVKSAALREQIDAFCLEHERRQRSHTEFLRRVLSQGHPGLEQRVDVLRRDFERFFQRPSDRFRIGYMVGFMAHALPVALRLLTQGAFTHPKTHADVSQHFSWHFAHWGRFKDLAEGLQDELFRGYLSRNFLASQARAHLFGFVGDSAVLVASADAARFGHSYRLRRLGSSPWASGGWWLRVKFAMPGFSMRRIQVPQALQLLAQISAPLWAPNATELAPQTAREASQVAA